MRHYRGTNPTIGGFFNDSFDSVAKAAKVKSPTLIVHPVDDQVINISHSKVVVTNFLLKYAGNYRKTS